MYSLAQRNHPPLPPPTTHHPPPAPAFTLTAIPARARAFWNFALEQSHAPIARMPKTHGYIGRTDECLEGFYVCQLVSGLDLPATEPRRPPARWISARQPEGFSGEVNILLGLFIYKHIAATSVKKTFERKHLNICGTDVVQPR